MKSLFEKYMEQTEFERTTGLIPKFKSVGKMIFLTDRKNNVAEKQKVETKNFKLIKTKEDFLKYLQLYQMSYDPKYDNYVENNLGKIFYIFYNYQLDGPDWAVEDDLSLK